MMQYLSWVLRYKLELGKEKRKSILSRGSYMGNRPKAKDPGEALSVI
jgi:hypothetical protein